MSSLVLVAAMSLVWIGTYRVIVKHPLDPGALMMYLLALDMVVRPTILALRLDQPFPDGLVGSTDHVLATTAPAFICWTIAFALGYVALAPVSGVIRPLLPRYSLGVSERRLAIAGWVAWGAGALGTLALLASAGSVRTFLRTAKLDRGFAGVAYLRSFSFVAVTVFVALLLQIRWKGTGNARRTVFHVLGFVSAAAMSFLWGARDAAVFGTAAMLIGVAVLFVPGERAIGRRLAARDWRRLLAYSVVAMCLVVGLRFYRDVLLYDEIQSSIADAPLVRQVSVASNNTQLDALALGMETWPSERPFNGGADFGNALLRSIPLVSVAAREAPALQLAHVYQPNRRAGWPMSPIGEWYINFGWIGVLLGGALSGALTRAMQRSFSRFASNPLAWVTAVMVVCRVFAAGIWTNSINRYILLVVPLVLVARYTRLRGSEIAQLEADEIASREAARTAVGDSETVSDGVLVAAGQGAPLVSTPVLPAFPGPTKEHVGLLRGTTARTRGHGSPSHPVGARWIDGLVAAGGDESGRPLDPPLETRSPRTGRRAARDGLLVLAGQVLSIVAGLALSVVASWTLPKEQVGQLAWALGLAGLLSVIASWGGSSAAISFVNIGGPAERRGRARALIQQCLVISAVTCGVWIVAVGPALAGASRDGGYRELVLVTAALVPTAALVLVIDGCLRGVQDFEGSVWAGDHVRRVVIVIVVALVGTEAVPVSLDVGLLAAPVVEAALIWFLYVRLRGRIDRDATGAVRVESDWSRTETFRRSSYFVPNTISSLIIPQSGIWLAALVMSSGEVADLSIAVRFSFLLNLTFFVGQRVFGPRVAARRGLVPEIETSMRAFTAFATALGLVVLGGYLLLGRWLIEWGLGANYVSAWGPLVVLSIGQVVLVAAGMGGMSLNYSGHTAVVSRVSVAAIAFFIPSTLLLGWLLGPMGVAIPAAVAIGGLGLVQNLAVRRLLDANMWPSWSALRTRLDRARR